MTMKHNVTSYRRFAVMLGALGLIAVACSDDDDDAIENPGGTAGSTAGKGGSSTAGKGGTGGSTAGKGGTGGSSAGTAGKAGSGSSGDTGMAGDTSMGGTGEGGWGQGGESVGGEAAGGASGAGGSGEGGAGGEPPIAADTLDNGTFEGYDAGWSESGDTAAATTKWIHDSEPGLNHYSATAFKVSTYQTVSPLPAGMYKLTAEVQKADSLIEQYLFAKGCKAGEPDFQQKQPTTAAGSGGYTLITLADIEVSSGSCTVGIYTDGPDGGWSNIDNFVFVKQ